MRKKGFVRVVAIIMAILLALSLVTAAVSVLSAGAVTKAQIEELKKKAEALKVQKQAVQSEINSLRYDQLSAVAKKTVLDNQINLTELEIDNLNEQIAAYEVMIAEKEVEVQGAKAREDAQWELYKTRIRHMEENGVLNYISVIFDADSYTDLLERIDDVSAVMRQDEDTYNKLVTIRLETIAAKEDLEETKALQETERVAMFEKQDELGGQIEESILLIEQIESELDSRTALFKQYDDDSAQLQKEINAKVEELRRQELAAQNAGRSTGSVVGSGSLQWPSAASSTVTSYFGTRWHPIYHVYRTHNGIDIGASYGTSILAADSGTVITSAYNSSFGNYVVLSHGNGMTTLYAHMSSRKVAVGDRVTKGSVIGLVGSTGASTGPHLHFEVSVGGSRVDPLNYFVKGTYSISANI